MVKKFPTKNFGSGFDITINTSLITLLHAQMPHLMGHLS
jgi:hypothetical protein